MSSSETRWKASAPVDGLSEALVALSAERASDAQLARLEGALAAQLAKPTRSASSGGSTASWLGRKGPWLALVLLGFGAAWQLVPQAAPPPARIAAPESPPALVAAPAEVGPALEPALAPVPMPVPRGATTGGKRAPRATEAARLPQPASPEAELALLRRAQSALNRSASSALAIADEHAQLYPNGLFAQEREMLRIEAELTLGKRHEALERAHAFAERFGSSTYRARIDRLLEAHRALKKQETPEPEPTQ